MSAVWWSALEAEHVTIEAEHVATRGDHYGTKQTGCPMCEPAEPVADGQLRIDDEPPVSQLILPPALTDEEAIELAATVLLQLRATTRQQPGLVLATHLPPT